MNVAYTLLIAGALASFWYLAQFTGERALHAVKHTAHLSRVGRAAGELKTVGASVPKLAVAYLGTIFPYQVSFFFSLVFFASLPLLIGLKARYAFFLFYWFFVPYGALTAIAIKSPRYIMPLLPVIALVISLGIFRIAQARLRRAVVSVIIGVGLVQFCVLSDIPEWDILEKRASPKLIRDFFYCGVSRYRSDFGPDWLRYYKRGHREQAEVHAQILDEMVAWKRVLAPKRTLRVGIIWPATLWVVFPQAPPPFPIYSRKLGIEIIGFYEDVDRFLEASPSFDLLILNSLHGGWPDQNAVIEGFRQCSEEKLSELTPTYMETLETALRVLRSSFVPVRVFKLDTSKDVYLMAPSSCCASGIDYLNTRATIENNELSVSFVDGEFVIVRNGTKVTKWRGFRRAFFVDGIEYTSENAFWDAQKTSPVGMTVTASWPQSRVKQVWDLRLDGESLEVRVDAVAVEDMLMHHLPLEFFLNAGYKDFLNRSFHGSLPPLRPTQQLQKVSPPGRGIIGIQGFSAHGQRFPSCMVDARGSAVLDYFTVARTRPEPGCVSLVVSMEPSRNPTRIRQGTTNLFSGRFTFFDEAKEMEERIRNIRRTQEVGNGLSALYFDAGSGYLSLGEKEITKYPGVYFQILSEEKVFLSTAAQWEVRKVSPERLTASGSWWEIPVLQTVEITAEDAHTFKFASEIELLKDFRIDEISFIAMCSERYDTYRLPLLNLTQEFPFIRQETDGWQPMWGRPRHITPQIGISDSRDGSGVVLDASGAPAEYELIISNTNNQHRARALVCHTDKETVLRLKKGKYRFPDVLLKVQQ